ncbi:hypothetical protein Tco_1067003 [Tanacetum coccineum]|uniref:Uncharacterized protein n=1 Tax=Tanacetum coccineum TaxID=301880 RepID=A0ABQ5HD13_9ASTR
MNMKREIAFLDGLLEDENFFETNDKKVEFLERKTKEDCETKVESEKKKELQVFHPDIETLNHLETNSYVGSDYVFYEDFNLVDMIFPMNIQGKIFDPGISHFDKSSKELAPSKALLTLDVFDPLHPPLMNFNEKGVDAINPQTLGSGVGDLTRTPVVLRYPNLGRKERIEKTKRSKNDQKLTRNERDKKKGEEFTSRISPTQQERQSKEETIKSRAKSDKL